MNTDEASTTVKPQLEKLGNFKGQGERITRTGHMKKS
jgi:hypothetical protein